MPNNTGNESYRSSEKGILTEVQVIGRSLVDEAMLALGLRLLKLREGNAKKKAPKLHCMWLLLEACSHQFTSVQAYLSSRRVS